MDRPLVVGAGPVGLGAALFLTRQGTVPRVVETRTEPSPWSKALAVNPRTLRILKPTGVTDRMLQLGAPIRGGQFHRDGKLLADISFEGLDPDFPFMLALSQAATERLLAEALAKAGGTVERGVKLVECRPVDGAVEAGLEPAAGGTREVVRCPWLLGADGAHSTVRHQLGIDFPGSAMNGEWFLADAPLRSDLATDRAHILFLPDGEFLFLLRVVDDARTEEAPLWRVLGNRPDPLSRLVGGEPAGPPVWESHFKVSHRVAAMLSSGGAYLAGDAAHIHSPVGARGMNLGLEDAWVFSELVRTGRMADYDRLRRPVDQGVVRRVEAISRVAAAETAPARFARAWLFPTATKLPFVRSRMRATISGLDHPLPEFAAQSLGA